MEIVRATEEQFPAVKAFYDTMIDSQKMMDFDLGWEKGVYPAPAFLLAALRSGTLFLAQESGEIVASMVVNHEGNESYRNFQWPTEAKDDEVTVIHTLAVHPARGRRGIGRRMVQFVLDEAKRSGQKAVRLDVLKGNFPAERLYEGLGFRRLHTLPMYYENTGWTEFELYEYAIE